MPWKEASVMEQRVKFVLEVAKGERSKSALCAAFGISRPTGDKWLERYAAEGFEGLEEQSRARHHQPHQMSEEVADRILKLRRQYKWGAGKLKAWLERHEAGQTWPAVSSIGELLRSEGLAMARKRARRASPSPSPLSSMEEANGVWCADFKGWFRTADGARCDPLTIMDGYSRFLLRCQSVGRTDFEHVQALFEVTFRDYGQPLVVRTDNGPPFASTGLLGLSRLSIWWGKLGIRHERIEPGKPQQNGRHERMHKTLKEQTASPPKATLRAQQRAFDAFRETYNHQRPHQALEQRPPGDLYQASPRAYTGQLQEASYPVQMETRRVEAGGQIKWRGRHLFISEVFRGEPVGVEDLDNGQLRLWYATTELFTVAISSLPRK